MPRDGNTPAFRLAHHGALIAISVVFALPLIWMISTSLKPVEQTLADPPTFVPRATVEMAIDQAQANVQRLEVEGLSGTPRHERAVSRLEALQAGDAPVDIVATLAQQAADNYVGTTATTPDGMQVEVTRGVWTDPVIDFPLYLRNTLIIAFLSVTGMVSSSAAVAYGVSRV